MPMPTHAVYFSRFKPTHDGGGGSRRMMQIRELFEKIVPGLRVFTNAGGDKKEKKLKKNIRKESERRDFFSPARRSPSLRKWGEDHRTLAYRLREFSKIWARAASGWQGCDLAIMDDPIYFAPLLEKLLRLGIPVVASCQNLETLAPNQVKKKWAVDFFKEELQLLSRCRLVITVSREEDVLLTNLGIPSLFFPYYPGEPNLRRLLAVRAERVDKAKHGLLAIGNAKNLQTRAGLAAIGRFWQENRMEAAAGKLLLGGFKSAEFFAPGHFGTGVELLGTLENDELDRILSRVKACICYQESGSGALTRICEMLIAGVPVLANTHAARTYYNRRGVIEFRELNELAAVGETVDALEGGIPLPQAPDIASLSLELQKIIH
jgi:hypothetical protein